MDILSLIFKNFITLLALVDPFMMIPIYLKLTYDLTNSEKNTFSYKVGLTVFIVLAFCIIGGKYLFDFLGLSIHSLRIAGGFFLFTMGTAMLFGHEMTAKSHGTEQDSSSLRLVPLAVPLLAGPSSISYVMTQHSKLWPYDIVFASLLVCIVVWLSFRFATQIAKYVEQSYLAIFERIAGLIVTVMAIEILAKGLKGMFPLLN